LIEEKHIETVTSYIYMEYYYMLKRMVRTENY
jgi:hypothetical protein